jgi:hypothetical protein
MPLALLTIGPSDLPSARVQLPGELEIDSQGGSKAH